VGKPPFGAAALFARLALPWLGRGPLSLPPSTSCLVPVAVLAAPLPSCWLPSPACGCYCPGETLRSRRRCSLTRRRGATEVATAAADPLDVHAVD
jgi:hypothetical protein